MGRIIVHPNEDVRQKSIFKTQQHYEAMTGKTDIVLTWERFGDCVAEHQYLLELRKRIRRERTLLSHIRPVSI